MERVCQHVTVRAFERLFLRQPRARFEIWDKSYRVERARELEISMQQSFRTFVRLAATVERKKKRERAPATHYQWKIIKATHAECEQLW